MKKILASIALSAVISCANAQFYSGNEIHDYGKGNAIQQAMVMGFIIGVHDGNRDVICLPAQMTTGQVRDVFLQWLSENPEIRHYSAGALVLYLLRDRWPCAKSAPDQGERRL